MAFWLPTCPSFVIWIRSYVVRRHRPISTDFDAGFTGTHKLSCVLRVPSDYFDANVVNTLNIYSYTALNWVYMVAQLVEALRYKPEGRGFYSRWGHWQFFRPRCGRGVDSASNRNVYQGCLLQVLVGRYQGLTVLPPTCADCLICLYGTELRFMASLLITNQLEARIYIKHV
jgi:hypothetical protein